jgi:WD40 repeat protein
VTAGGSWDVATGEVLGRDARAIPVAATPDGLRLLVDSYGPGANEHKVLDLRTGAAVPVRWTGSVRYDDPFTWSPDGRRLAAGAHDGRTHVWDATSGELVLTLPGDEAAVKATAWSRDGTRLAALDASGAVRIWDARPGRDR